MNKPQPFFFTLEIIDEMKERPTVKKYLSNSEIKLELYTLATINSLFKKNKDGTEKVLTSIDILPKGSNLFKAASAPKTVRRSYFHEQITNVLDNKSEYDILILANNALPYTPISMVIVQVGECKEKPKIPALKLIFGKGDIMLYSYIYALRKHNFKEGILELANGFENMAGLCAYNKFGFRENMLMKTQNCFSEFDTLPMSVDVTKMTDDELDISLSAKKGPNGLYDKLDKDPTSEPLCDNDWRTSHETARQSRNKLYKNRDGYEAVNKANPDDFTVINNIEIQKQSSAQKTSKSNAYSILKTLKPTVITNNNDNTNKKRKYGEKK